MENQIGLALRLARTSVGKTQFQISQKLGIHPVTVNYFECGKRVPSPETIRAMLKIIKTDAPKNHLVDVVLGAVERVLNDANAN